MDLRDKKVLITGGKGFLGTHVADEIKRLGLHIEDLDQNIVNAAKPGTAYVFKSETADLTSIEQTYWLFKKIRPDVVIHLAAAVGGIKANSKAPGTFFYKNMAMGMNVIEACRIYKTSKLAIIGTVCSYPKWTPTPFKEIDLWNGYPEETNAPYGIAKKALFVQADAYKKEYGMDSICLLPVNLYGPHDNFDLETSHVIPALIKKMYDAKKYDMPKMECWGSGSASREFLYVKDAAAAIVKAVTFYNKTEPVNIGTGQEITIADLANKIKEYTRYRGEIVWRNDDIDGQKRRCLDTTKATEEFGFTARTTLDEGLKETIKWYDQNN